MLLLKRSVRLRLATNRLGKGSRRLFYAGAKTVNAKASGGMQISKSVAIVDVSYRHIGMSCKNSEQYMQSPMKQMNQAARQELA